jgi:hypothetical protein
MSTTYLFRSFALFLVGAVLVAGCDGFETGTPPDEGDDRETTIGFETGALSITEEAGSAPLELVLGGATPSDSVTAEILFAEGISEADASDFNLSADRQIGDNAFLAGSVTFVPDDSAGTTKTVNLNIQDDTPDEDKETGVFVLQNVQNAVIGDSDTLAISIGTIRILDVTFSDGDLDPMTPFSVSSSTNWETSTAGGDPNVPYAAINAFNGDRAANDWLISPALDFDVLTDETLSFLNARNFSDDGLRDNGEEPLRILISTDYSGSGNPETATWTDVTDRVQEFSEGGFNFVSSGEIDLSDDAFQSGSTYIAFQYRSSGAGSGTSEAQQIDSIVLTSTTAPSGQ